MFDLTERAANSKEPLPVDLAESVHEAMAHSMLLLIIGEVCQGYSDENITSEHFLMARKTPTRN